MSSNFHHLVRGIITDGEKVLAARAIGHKNTFLPGGHVEFGESAPIALQREIEEELGLSCRIEGYLGLVEHQWLKNNELHCEINQAFKVIVPELDVSRNPPSRESHIEFIWVSVNELENYRLQPFPFRKLIPQLVNGDRSVWWESTLNLEIDAENIG
ncbi:NUDIX domain-containing protein [Paenibacillus arenilitoris]|uniref:NUDIX domain-containing protein n=1 Tax=Paenibacillus arenilitoris TaxID=2772299 RepID=A0A927CNH6_9BACL|nr:NUDIX domain-containing protein [Paenibacillus arenilitoris]MBD2869066.1 NUDIX domain-containing protein [Paenibacillus arenilitoris]